MTIDGLLDMMGLVRKAQYGVAFGGGGARGFSHIGVLKAMESFNVRPGIVSGVSAGSIAASASQVLGLKVCATTAQHSGSILFGFRHGKF